LSLSSIYFKLKSTAPIKVDGKLSRAFVIDSRPTVAISDPGGANKIMQYLKIETDRFLKEMQKFKDSQKT
jgi:hypothetical protein